VWCYLGVFVFSFFANAFPFIPVPYLLVILTLSSTVSHVNPLLLGVLSGLGGGVGKLVVYFFGWGVSRVLNGRFKWEVLTLRRLPRRYAVLLAFLVTATPLPDDIVLIILGLARCDLFRYFMAVTAGKVLIGVYTSYFGVFLRGFNLPIYVFALLITVAFVISLKVERGKALGAVLGSLSKILKLQPLKGDLSHDPFKDTSMRSGESGQLCQVKV